MSTLLLSGPVAAEEVGVAQVEADRGGTVRMVAGAVADRR